MCERNFIYKCKSYSFNINQFHNYSTYVFNNKNKNILLFENGNSFDVSNESISSFILFFQDGIAQITNSTAIPLHFLSIKYEVLLLTKQTEEYIKIHYSDIINDFLSLNIKKIQEENDISQYEELISQHILEFIDDDRLFNFPVSSLYRILMKYSLQNKNDNKNNKIISFLFKYLETRGVEASILFSLIEIDEQAVEYVSLMLSKYFNNFDFRFIDQSFYQSVVLIIKQQKQQQELFQKQISLIFFKLNNVQLPNVTEVITGGQFRNFQFKGITIPSTCKIIKEEAFFGCKSLIELIIPESVENIGSFAFADCSSLQKVNIPSSVKLIGKAAFANCVSLKQISIPNSLARIDDETFRNCLLLDEITIPDSVESIGSFAFADCSSLKTVKIHSVKVIQKRAFANCSSLKQISFPFSLTKIVDEAFRNCTALTELTIPASIEIIGSFAFADCSSLNSITIDIVSSLTSFSKGIFFNCSSLKKISFPSSLAKIDDEAFRNCNSLTDIIIPSSVKSVGSFAFTDCSSLKTIIISDSLASISKGMFLNCTSLEKVSIPPSIIKIDDEAFMDCKSLTEITFPSFLISIGSRAFSGCSLKINFSESVSIQLIYKSDISVNELPILENIKDIQTFLLTQKIPSEYNILKYELIDQLNKIVEFTKKKYIFIRELVDEFLSYVKTPNSFKGETIFWPKIKENTHSYSDRETENTKLFDAIIWYSQIDKVLNEIKFNKNLINNLWILNKLLKPSYSSGVSLTDLFNETLLPNDHYKSILNAHMIWKLLNINKSFIDDPQQITNVFNSYIKRSLCDEREFQWINEISSCIPSDLSLLIPKFEPKDLIFLVVNEISHSEYKNGPLFNEMQDLVFLKDLKHLMYCNFESFYSAAQSVAQIVFREIISSNEEPPKNYEDLKSVFHNFDGITETNCQIVERIQTMFAIADALDKRSEPNLLFDDLSFLKIDCLKDQEIINQFPSLIFWFLKYKSLTDQLIVMFKSYEPMPNQIPFWLLAFRIMSSFNCIEFEIQPKNKNILIIKDKISKIVVEYLNNSINHNDPINYDWINILISEPPHEIADPNIRIFHDFFSSLMNDMNRSHEELNDIKITLMSKIVSEIIKIILLSEAPKIMANDLSKQNDINQFLISPSNFVQKKILESTYKLILTNESTIKLREFLRTNNLFNDLTQSLINAINEDLEEMKKIKPLTNEMINEIKSFVDAYKKTFSNILKSEYKQLNKKVYNLKKYQKHLQQYPVLFKDECITLTRISYRSNKPFQVKICENEKKITYEFPVAFHIEHIFLKPGQIIMMKDNLTVWQNIIHDEKISFRFIKENIDFDNINPTLLFGRQSIPEEKYLKRFEKLNNLLNSLETIFFSDLELNEKKKKDISFLREIEDLLIMFRDNSKARFSNNFPSPKVQQVLQNEVKGYLDNLYVLFQPFLHLVKHILSSKERFIIDIHNKKLFSYLYDIQVPQIVQQPRFIPNFSHVSFINEPDVPIIFENEENQINCSVKELKCVITPIFPSLICSPYLINVIFLIYDKVSIKIDNLNDHQHIQIITLKNNLNINHTMQLIINPPKTSANEPEIILLKGDLNIQVRSHDPLIIPFEIKLGILPMKIRLCCLEYKLVEESQSFRLCCDKIISEKKINFEIIEYYVHEHFELQYNLKQLDGNESRMPNFFFNKKSGNFSLLIPKVNDLTRSHFIIIIALTNNLLIKIHCDFIIIPDEFNENEILMSKMSLIKLPEKNQEQECFIISEKESPIPCSIKDNLGSFELANDEDCILSDMLFSLPQIEIPEILTIKNMNAFYINCSKGAAFLPSLIRSNLNNKFKQNELEIYFGKLIQIFIKINFKKDKSILSGSINSFNYYFKRCLRILMKSGVDFKNQIPHNLFSPTINDNIDFIIIPKIITPGINDDIIVNNRERLNGNKI